MAITVPRRRFRLSLKWLKPPPTPPDGAMTLVEHLRELRYRLIVAVLAIVVGMILSAFFFPQLFELLTKPYFAGIEALKAKRPEAVTSLVTTDLAAPFLLALKVCAVAGAAVTAPIWLYQLWAFIVPGLYAREKKWSLIFLGAATPLFLAGIATAYVVLPKGISVLLSFTQAGVTNLQDINTYLSFLLRLMIVFGIAYLLPLVVVVLNLTGVVTAKQLASARKYFVFGAFVFGAVATPSTDVFSMLALALPMALLFVLAEVVAHLVDRRRAKRAKTAGLDSVAAGSVGRDRALRELSETEPEASAERDDQSPDSESESDPPRRGEELQ